MVRVSAPFHGSALCCVLILTHQLDTVAGRLEDKVWCGDSPGSFALVLWLLVGGHISRQGQSPPRFGGHCVPVGSSLAV